MAQQSSPDTSSLVHKPNSLKVVASGIDGPEGPAIAPDGTLFIVSTGAGAILAVGKDGSVREHAKTGGRPNGLAFDSDGVMYVADAGRKAILRVTDSGAAEPFIDSFEGSPLDGPNDLVFLGDGSLLFSDPLRVPAPNPAISPVYRALPDGTLTRFYSDLAYPNGVAFSVSGDEVFVSEMRAHRVVGFGLDEEMNAVGQRMVRRFRDPAAPDGMAVDSDGSILVALPGIRALAVVGTRNDLEQLYHVEEWQPSNLCFGDRDMRTVFVTSESDGVVYSFRHDAPGQDLHAKQA